MVAVLRIFYLLNLLMTSAIPEPTSQSASCLNGDSKYKAVIFDMDGTLLDTEKLSDKAMLAVLAPAGLPKDVSQGTLLPWELKKQLLGLRGLEWAPIVISYANETWGVPLDKLPTPMELWTAWENKLNEFCEQVEECPGASALVDSFEKLGMPMAIATSSRAAAVAKKRKRHEVMFAKMKHIVAGDHPAVKNGKPAPDIYLEAARQLGVEPSECLVFEDALSGVRSARAAGCTVVAIPDSRFNEEERVAFVNEADVVVDSLVSFDGRPMELPVYSESPK